MNRYRLTLSINGDRYPVTLAAATEDAEGNDQVYRDADLAEVARIQTEIIVDRKVEKISEEPAEKTEHSEIFEP